MSLNDQTKLEREQMLEREQDVVNRLNARLGIGSDSRGKIIEFMEANHICGNDAADSLGSLVDEMISYGLVNNKTDPAKIAYSWLAMCRAQSSLSDSFWNAGAKSFESKAD